jgi:hypothetical protein
MVTKKEVIKSLKKQGLVNDPDSWRKLAQVVACTSVKVKKGKRLDEAVYECCKEVS